VSEEQKINQPEVYKQQPAKSSKLSGQKPALSSYRSYWPLALAIALCIVLVGIIVNTVILGIGIVLTIVAVIAWSLERR
jgi:Cytochrome c oxidase subunit IV